MDTSGLVDLLRIGLLNCDKTTQTKLEKCIQNISRWKKKYNDSVESIFQLFPESVQLVIYSYEQMLLSQPNTRLWDWTGKYRQIYDYAAEM